MPLNSERATQIPNSVTDPLMNTPMFTILACWCSYPSRWIHRRNELSQQLTDISSGDSDAVRPPSPLTQIRTGQACFSMIWVNLVHRDGCLELHPCRYIEFTLSRRSGLGGGGVYPSFSTHSGYGRSTSAPGTFISEAMTSPID